MVLEIPYLVGLYEGERPDRQRKVSSEKKGIRSLFSKHWFPDSVWEHSFHCFTICSSSDVAHRALFRNTIPC